jgi:colicin import membrane protein
MCSSVQMARSLEALQLQLEHYKTQWRELVAQRSEMELAAEEQRGQLESVTAERDELTALYARELAERDFAHSQLRQELDQTQLRLHRAQGNAAIDLDDTEVLLARMEVLKNDKRVVAAQRDLFVQELSSVLDRYADQAEMLHAWEQENATLRAQLSSQTNTLSSVQADVRAIQGARDSMELIKLQRMVEEMSLRLERSERRNIAEQQQQQQQQQLTIAAPPMDKRVQEQLLREQLKFLAADADRISAAASSTAQTAQTAQTANSEALAAATAHAGQKRKQREEQLEAEAAAAAQAKKEAREANRATAKELAQKEADATAAAAAAAAEAAAAKTAEAKQSKKKKAAAEAASAALIPAPAAAEPSAPSTISHQEQAPPAKKKQKKQTELPAPVEPAVVASKKALSKKKPTTKQSKKRSDDDDEEEEDGKDSAYEEEEEKKEPKESATARVGGKWNIKIGNKASSINADANTSTSSNASSNISDLQARLAAAESTLAADALDVSAALNDSTASSSSTGSSLSAAERRRKLFPNAKRTDTLAQAAAARAAAQALRSPLVVKMHSQSALQVVQQQVAYRKPLGASTAQPTAVSSSNGHANPLHKAFAAPIPTTRPALVGLPAVQPQTQHAGARSLFMHFLAGGLKAPKIRQQ